MTSTIPRGNVTAAEHFQVINDPEATPEAIEAALRWIEEDEANRTAYQHIARFMQSCETISDSLVPAELAEELSETTRGRSGWSLAGGYRIAAGLVLVLVGLSALMLGIRGYFGGSGSANTQMRYATAIGETRLVRLPDGSSVMLGGASAISISFAPDRRDIALTDGEAFFKVAHDVNRPFIVSAAMGSVRAVGTQFDVHRTPLGASVAVAEGTVHVSSGPRFAALQAGMQISYSPDGQMTAISAVDPSRIPEWQGGLLHFRAEPLSLVVADLNRYSSRPIVIGSPGLADEEITGTARVDQIPEWLSGLAAASDITIRRGSDGTMILTSPRAQPAHAVARGHLTQLRAGSARYGRSSGGSLPQRGSAPDDGLLAAR